MIKKITTALKVFFLQVKNLIVGTKLSEAKVKGKKSQFTKELGLIKAERQEIPLPKVTEHEHKDKKKNYFEEQADIQQYYLYQFTSVDRNIRKKRTKDIAKQNVAEFISLMHFLSYKNDAITKSGGFSPLLYKVNVNSVQFSQNKQR